MTKKWIAENGYVLEEGGEADSIICDCGNYDEPNYCGLAPVQLEAAHRMAQIIANEHNAIIVLKNALDNMGYRGVGSLKLLPAIKKVLDAQL